MLRLTYDQLRELIFACCDPLAVATLGFSLASAINFEVNDWVAAVLTSSHG